MTEIRLDVPAALKERWENLDTSVVEIIRNQADGTAQPKTQIILSNDDHIAAIQRSLTEITEKNTRSKQFKNLLTNLVEQLHYKEEPIEQEEEEEEELVEETEDDIEFRHKIIYNNSELVEAIEDNGGSVYQLRAPCYVREVQWGNGDYAVVVTPDEERPAWRAMCCHQDQVTVWNSIRRQLNKFDYLELLMT